MTHSKYSVLQFTCPRLKQYMKNLLSAYTVCMYLWLLTVTVHSDGASYAGFYEVRKPNADKNIEHVAPYSVRYGHVAQTCQVGELLKIKKI